MNRPNRRPPRLRPPSAALPRRARPTHTTLPLRTADDTASAVDQPAFQQLPGGRLAIPQAKLDKALRLYATWIQAQELARLEAAGISNPSDSSFLAVPNTSTINSFTSAGSSRRNRGTSISTSMYEATDLSSVVSFDDIASISTANTTSRELTAYDGTRVSQRTRRNFDPAGRAKTALVRWLGACDRCKTRSVSCSLEDHHDIATLDRLYHERRREDRTRSRPRSRSSVSNSSQQTTTSRSGGQQNTQNTSSTSRDLFGMGQNERLLQPEPSFSLPNQDLQSPGGFADPLEGIVAPTPIVTDLHYVPTIQMAQPMVSPDSYVPYQNGDIVLLGLQEQGLYVCCYKGACRESFEDLVELETHFECTHLPIFRLRPAIRYLCSHCFEMNNFSSGPCQSCGFQSTIQTWVCAQYFCIFSNQQDPGDGPAPMRYDPPAPYYPAAFPPHNADTTWAPGPYNSNGNLGGRLGNDANGSSFDNNLESYGDPGNEDHEYNIFNGSENGGQGYQGNWLRSARPMALKHSLASNAIKLCRRRFSLIFFAFLTVASILTFSYDWLVNEDSISSTSACLRLREHLPMLGFIGIVASFGLSLFLQHTFVYLQQVLIPRDPLPSLSPYSWTYQDATQTIYSSCNVYL